MENTLFYTFSTIAQTLPAAIALLGALVLYRLQVLAQILERDLSKITQPYVLSEEAVAFVEAADYSKVLEYLARTNPFQPNLIETVHYKARKTAFEILISLQCQLKRLLKISLVLTVVVAGAAVAVIAFVPTIVQTSGAATCTLVVGVAAFVGCLVAYAILAHRTIA